MDRPNIVQMTHRDASSIDWRKAEKSIRIVGEGGDKSRAGYSPKIVVEFLPKVERIGSVLLPDDSQGNLRADLAVVLKSCEGAPRPGAVVIVRPYDGAMFEGADMGAYRPRNRIAIYGVYAPFDFHPEACPWHDSVVAELRDDMLIPLGDKIHIEFDKAEAVSQGGILLPDIALQKSGMATVRAVGPLAQGLRPGDRVCYDERLLLETGLRLDPMNGTNMDYAICDERAILYVVEDAGWGGMDQECVAA